MSKRSHTSEAAEPAAESLVERLTASANDADLPIQIVESSDNASITAVLAIPSSEAISDVKRQKKTRNQTSIPTEMFLEILLFADRDVLDAMQLVCLFLHDFIRGREDAELPLRSISRVIIGKRNVSSWEAIFELTAGREVFPDTVKQRVAYLRLAVCDSVNMNLQWTGAVEDVGEAYREVFDDLVVPRTFSKDALTICVDYGSAPNVLRAIEAFKPLCKVVVKDLNVYLDWGRIFDETFFLSSAKCGVRSIVFDSCQLIGVDDLTEIIEIRPLPALSFGFAEPTIGGDRSIAGVDLELKYGENFLAMLIEKASELDGHQRIDFKFTIEDFTHTDPAGFEKYQKGQSTWE